MAGSRTAALGIFRNKCGSAGGIGFRSLSSCPSNTEGLGWVLVQGPIPGSQESKHSGEERYFPLHVADRVCGVNFQQGLNILLMRIAALWRLEQLGGRTDAGVQL